MSPIESVAKSALADSNGFVDVEKETLQHKKYKNVFAWNYDNLRMFDTSIVKHTIPMISDEKPVQQKLRKIHPNHKSQIK